jgi:hypothetical protein
VPSRSAVKRLGFPGTHPAQQGFGFFARRRGWGGTEAGGTRAYDLLSSWPVSAWWARKEAAVSRSVELPDGTVPSRGPVALRRRTMRFAGVRRSVKGCSTALLTPSNTPSTSVATLRSDRGGVRRLWISLFSRHRTATYCGCLMDVQFHILRRAFHESRSLLWLLDLRRLQSSLKGRALKLRYADHSSSRG